MFSLSLTKLKFYSLNLIWYWICLFISFYFKISFGKILKSIEVDEKYEKLSKKSNFKDLENYLMNAIKREREMTKIVDQKMFLPKNNGKYGAWSGWTGNSWSGWTGV